jgi:hypothetical protein
LRRQFDSSPCVRKQFPLNWTAFTAAMRQNRQLRRRRREALHAKR